jgi:hypothetical protein
MRKSVPTISQSFYTLEILSYLVASVNALPTDHSKVLASRDFSDSPTATTLVIIGVLFFTLLGPILALISFWHQRDRIIYWLRYQESKPTQTELSRCWKERSLKVKMNRVFVAAAASEHDLWQCWRFHGMRYREDIKARYAQDTSKSSGGGCA